MQLFARLALVVVGSLCNLTIAQAAEGWSFVEVPLGKMYDDDATGNVWPVAEISSCARPTGADQWEQILLAPYNNGEPIKAAFFLKKGAWFFLGNTEYVLENIVDNTPRDGCKAIFAKY